MPDLLHSAITYTCPHCEEEFGDDDEFFEHESVCGGNINNAVEMYQQQESGNG